jgi:sec-independent protein translocase protein TatC
MPARKTPPDKILARKKSTGELEEISLTTKESSMTLIGHLEDLRKRLLKACLGWISATLVCYYFSQEIINFLVEPLAHCMSYKIGRHLIYTDLSEAFLTHVRVACVSGFALAFPYIAAQLWLFIAPGLYKSEKKVFLSLLLLSPLLFLGGVLMAYYGIFPLAWSFFLSFQENSTTFSDLFSSSYLPLNLEPRVSSYLDLSLSLMMAFGICFQLPLILLLLSRFHFIHVHHLRQYRRHAIVGIFIVSAVMTPPDIFSQLLLALPLIGLYELSILLIRLFPSFSRP